MKVSYNNLVRFIWQFICLQKWIFLTVLILDFFTWSLDVLLWPYILHVVIDIFAQYDTERLAAWTALKTPITCALALTLYIETSSRSMGFLMAKAVPKLQRAIRHRMFDHIQHHSPHYFNERFAGSLANKISDMTTQVESILYQLFWPIIPTIAACILGTGFLWNINPLFAWIWMGWIVIHFSLCFKFTTSVTTYEQKHGEARTTLLGKIVDSFTNNTAVNLFYRFSYENKRLNPFAQIEESTNTKAKVYVEKMRCVLSIFYMLAAIIGVFGSMIYLWLHGFITTGQAVQVFTTMWGLAMILWATSSSLPILFQSLGIAKQAYTVMLEPQDLGDQPDAKDLSVSTGSIVFRDVSFHYGQHQLFKNKNISIRGGEKIGLVGYTGAGKSTFINLILRLFPLHQGEILIDGQNIARVSLASLRRNIALIPQDPILFHRSLQENIAYGKPEASTEEILQAARLAHCDEFIRKLPKGYDSTVGERGTKLSGGEKQRIAIARALLVDAPILILDEATSSLDSLTEKYIQESLAHLMKEKTTLVIAHRLSTLANMDRILVFEKGEIVEEGSHNALLAKQGLYAKMWSMQAGGFLPDMDLSS